MFWDSDIVQEVLRSGLRVFYDSHSIKVCDELLVLVSFFFFLVSFLKLRRRISVSPSHNCRLLRVLTIWFVSCSGMYRCLESKLCNFIRATRVFSSELRIFASDGPIHMIIGWRYHSQSDLRGLSGIHWPIRTNQAADYQIRRVYQRKQTTKAWPW